MATEITPTAGLTADVVVDARGTLCPIPIVLLNRAVQASQDGAIVKLIATDKGARADVPAWADDTENEFLGAGEEDGALVFWLRKTA